MEHLVTGLVQIVVGLLFVFHGGVGVKFQELPLKGGRRLKGRSAVVRGWIHIVVGAIFTSLGIGFVGYWLAIKFF